MANNIRSEKKWSCNALRKWLTGLNVNSSIVVGNLTGIEDVWFATIGKFTILLREKFKVNLDIKALD